MSGQARFIEYVLVVFLGIFVIVSMVSLFYSFYISSITSEARQTLKQIAVQTADGIVKLYNIAKASNVEPSNYSSIKIVEVDLKLPTHVARRNYEVMLVTGGSIWLSVANVTSNGQRISTVEHTGGAKVIAKTTQDPIIEVEQDLPNMDVEVQGRSVNGVDAVLRLYRYNINGTKYDTIILGNYTILINVETVE